MIKLVILLLALAFISCQGPRSATMCLNENSEWVKCPKGVEPGSSVKTIKTTKTK